MVLLGHTHTHEFAAGGTTDQVGNPWALDRSAGGSSGGSAAALAARMVPAATGTDTAGSLRIPSALSGISTIKPTRGLVSLRGDRAALAEPRPRAGRWRARSRTARSLLAAMAGTGRRTIDDRAASRRAARRLEPRSLAGVRIAVSPRIGELDADVAAGFDAALDACRRLGAEIVAPIADVPPLDVLDDYTTVLLADLLAYHRRFDGRRDLYRPSIREFVERAEEVAHARGGVRRRRRRAGATSPRAGPSGSPRSASPRCSSRPCPSSRRSAAPATTTPAAISP